MIGFQKKYIYGSKEVENGAKYRFRLRKAQRNFCFTSSPVNFLINHFFKKITRKDHPFAHLKKVGMANRNIVYIKF